MTTHIKQKTIVKDKVNHFFTFDSVYVQCRLGCIIGCLDVSSFGPRRESTRQRFTHITTGIFRSRILDLVFILALKMPVVYE